MGQSPLLTTSNSNVDKNNMYKERQRKDSAMLAGDAQMHDCELLSFDIQVCETWEMFGWEWLVSNRFQGQKLMMKSHTTISSGQSKIVFMSGVCAYVVYGGICACIISASRNRCVCDCVCGCGCGCVCVFVTACVYGCGRGCVCLSWLAFLYVLSVPLSLPRSCLSPPSSVYSVHAWMVWVE